MRSLWSVQQGLLAQLWRFTIQIPTATKMALKAIKKLSGSPRNATEKKTPNTGVAKLKTATDEAL